MLDSQSTTEDIARRFARLDSSELLRIVGVDSRSHQPTALAAAMSELRQRGLGFDSSSHSVDPKEPVTMRKPATPLTPRLNEKHSLAPLAAAAAATSGLLLIASFAPDVVRSFDAVSEVPGSGGRLIVGLVLLLLGLVLTVFHRRR